MSNSRSLELWYLLYSAANPELTSDVVLPVPSDLGSWPAFRGLKPGDVLHNQNPSGLLGHFADAEERANMGTRSSTLDNSSLFKIHSASGLLNNVVFIFVCFYFFKIRKADFVAMIDKDE